jgi:hypothetical protein
MNRKTVLTYILVVLALTAAILAWYRGQSPTVISRTAYVKVPEIKMVTKIKRVMVPVKEIVTIEKQAISEKLKLPDEVTKDANKQIITTGEVTPYEGKTNVIAVLDTATGESELIAKQQPLPFVDFENKREIGLRYGATIKNGMETDIYGRWDFLRVGGMHLGLYAEANSNSEAKAMISVGYRW